MKKSFIILSVCIFFIQVMFAQLKVASNGKVGIQLPTGSTPASPLSIGGVGATSNKVDIDFSNFSCGLKIHNNNTTSSVTTYGLWSVVPPLNNYPSYAVRGTCLSSDPTTGKAWGMCGSAGGGIDGYNYGVQGTLFGENNGAGIFGSIGASGGVNIPGQYAGYFYGNVAITGLLNGNAVCTNSDIRYKKNIVQLESKKTFDNVLLLNPIEYNLEQLYYDEKPDTAKVKKGVYDENSQLFKKKHYGLIAQDLQKLYPDLVYEDAKGYLSVNYTGIIPLLIESVKELNAEIETLKAKTNGSSKVKSSSEITETDVLTYPVLDQNIPNPFNTATTIGFYLPTTIAIASIYVYDMNGVQLKSYTISDRGKKNIIINGSEFNAGMYLYALIADGKVIDTKRMILTK